MHFVSRRISYINATKRGRPPQTRNGARTHSPGRSATAPPEQPPLGRRRPPGTRGVKGPGSSPGRPATGQYRLAATRHAGGRAPRGGGASWDGPDFQMVLRGPLHVQALVFSTRDVTASGAGPGWRGGGGERRGQKPRASPALPRPAPRVRFNGVALAKPSSGDARPSSFHPGLQRGRRQGDCDRQASAHVAPGTEDGRVWGDVYFSFILTERISGTLRTAQ